MILDKKLSPNITDLTLKIIDTSIVNWFKTDFALTINGRQVPTLYATAERWRRAQIDKGFRDEKGALMLPLISIRRTTPDTSHKERYAPEDDATNITVVKRIATTPISENDRQPAIVTNRIADELYINTKDTVVYEIVQMPYPSFVNLNYEIIVWTSYMSHQNLEQENIFKEFKGGRQYFFIDNYAFLGTLSNIVDNSNLEEFSDKEKIIKYTFSLLVRAYLIDSKKIKKYRTLANIKMKFTESIIDKIPG